MVGIKDFEMPNTCGDCPYCIHTADEKRYIGYCNTSDDDYYCKALDRFMEYDEVDGGVDILGKPSDCPLVEAIPKDHITRAIDKVEEYICDVETDTVKAQGMAQALDIFEQALGEVEDGND